MKFKFRNENLGMCRGLCGMHGGHSGLKSHFNSGLPKGTDAHRSTPRFGWRRLCSALQPPSMHVQQAVLRCMLECTPLHCCLPKRAGVNSRSSCAASFAYPTPQLAKTVRASDFCKNEILSSLLWSSLHNSLQQSFVCGCVHVWVFILLSECMSA